jgi:GDP/UDP-N,N'-diacetylbacillosamine 2-epimerase (hydrolysing)
VNRRICVVTGNRADYGLLRWLMHDVAADASLRLQVVATGMHLWPDAGSTYREIEGDGFHIDGRIPLPLGDDSAAGVAASLGTATIGFATAFRDLAPDLVVVLGDRFEILAAAAAALIARIPVAHLHGGERSEGAFDDSIRHAVTKMSHLHFVAAPEFRDRVVQLGEEPSRVFVVGALGLDAIARATLLSRAELESSLGFALGRRNLVVTFHPPTLDADGDKQFNEVLAALDTVDDTTIVMTMPNTDTGGIRLWQQAKAFAAGKAHVHLVESLGSRRYLSLLALVDGVVGNSSSALIEAPAFRIGSVNIGSRQRGRLKAASVIDCPAERGAIADAIARLYSTEFRSALASMTNPYGTPGASARIVEILRTVAVGDLIHKTFFDLGSTGARS